MARKTKEEAQETRHRILDAAEQVFQRKGVSRTSLADIAAEAGVTRGAIYWHFQNKAELFDAMIHRVFELPEDMPMDHEGPEGGAPLDWVRTVVMGILQRLARDAQFHRVAEIVWHKCEYVAEMAEIRDRHLECGNRYISTMERAMRQAQTLGQLRADLDPRQAAVGLMALMDGLIVNWTLDPALFPLADYADGIVTSYLTGLCTPH